MKLFGRKNREIIRDKYTIDDKAIERLSIALMGRIWETNINAWYEEAINMKLFARKNREVIRDKYTIDDRAIERLSIAMMGRIG